MQKPKPLLVLAVLCSLVLGSGSSIAAGGGNGGQGQGGGGQGQGGKGKGGNQPPLPDPPLPPEPPSWKCPDRRAACVWSDDHYNRHLIPFEEAWMEGLSDSHGGNGWINLYETHRRQASSARNNFANRVVRFSTKLQGGGPRICLRAGRRIPQFGPEFNDAIRSMKVSKLGGSCPEGG